MELKVGNAMFNSSGGGGGSFYMGRGDKDEKRKGRDEDEAPGELEGDELALGRDGVRLPPRHRSGLSLGMSLPAPVPVDEEALVAELEDAVSQKIRLLNITLSRLERDYARRLRAEIGEMVIGA